MTPEPAPLATPLPAGDPERILLLGAGPLAERLANAIREHAGGNAVVVGVLDDRTPDSTRLVRGPFVGRFHRLESLLGQLRPDRIVISMTGRPPRSLVRTLREISAWRGIVIDDGADYYERLTGKVAIEALTPLAVLRFGRRRRSDALQVARRVFDLMVAAPVLVLTSPLLLLIAVTIRIESPGPVLFVQPRAGERGRPFRLLKFRTMRERLTGRSEWECDNRDRVTRIGRWLRTFRLDELPQMVNVLRGEMAIVGPRPHPVSNLELLTLVARNLDEMTGSAMSCYGLRSLVRPGITGWAQVRYRYANNLEEEIEKLGYDLYYVKHMSIPLDLRILFETIRVVVLGRVHGQPPVVATPPARRRARHTAAGTVLGFMLFTIAMSCAAVAQTTSPGQVMRSVPPPTAAVEPPRTPTVPAVPPFIIGPGDVLEVTVWNNTALSRTMPVRPDGKISMPVLQDVQAAGYTAVQLQLELTKALSAGFIKSPEVSVIVREVHSKKISVLGHVKAPGRFDVNGALTALDALALAGGLDEFADRKHIVLLRYSGTSNLRLEFSYDAVASGKAWNDGKDKLMVLPGDIIMVR